MGGVELPTQGQIHCICRQHHLFFLFSAYCLYFVSEWKEIVMPVQRILALLFRSRSELRRRTACGGRGMPHCEALESRALLTSLIGADVTVSGTFQSNSMTGGQEAPFAGPQRVVAEQSPNDPELVQYSGLYDVDIDGDRISMVYHLSPDFGSDPSRIIEGGTFYRYYFDIEGLAPNEFISSVSAEPTRNLVPNVSLVGGDTIVVEIGPGMQLGNNFNALILVEVDQTPRSIIGNDFTVSHTYESSLETSGVEVPVGVPATATITSGGPELVSFADIYDIDVDSDSISMVFNLDPGAGSDPSRVIEAGTFDRYYFEFDLGTNEFLSTASAAPAATLVPSVSISGSDTIVVAVGPGMQIGNGFNALIDFEVGIVGSEVSGRKWNDLNNDGVWSSGEAWLNGWQMQLLDPIGNIVDTTFTRNIDLDGNGQINPATEMGVYLFEGVQNGNYRVEEVLKQSWVQSYPVRPSAQLAFELNRDLLLSPSASEFLNWGGLNEKWMLGSGLWYFITPDGAFYRWNGSPQSEFTTGAAVAQLNPTYYNDLSLLYDAAEPQPNVADVVVPNAATGLNFGNYLAPPQFTVDPVQATNTVTFHWNEATTDSAYEVWITDIATARRFEVTTGIAGDTYTTSLPDRRYRVWMRTEYSPGVFSAWSASQEFEFLRGPIDPIIAGLDAGIDATPTIQWTPQTNAVSYDVRVTDATGNVRYLAAQIPATSHRIATALPLGSHQVSVRGNYTDGSRNDWSPGQLLVITGRPEVQLSGRVVSWLPVKAATDYEVWVDRVDSAGNRLQRQVVYANGIKELSYTLPSLPNGTYDLWVRAIRAESGEQYPSFWSAKVNFFIGANADEDPLQTVISDLRLASLTSETAEQDPATAATAEPLAANEPRTDTSQFAAENLPAERAADRNPGPLQLVHAVMQQLAESEMPVPDVL